VVIGIAVLTYCAPWDVRVRGEDLDFLVPQRGSWNESQKVAKPTGPKTECCPNSCRSVETLPNVPSYIKTPAGGEKRPEGASDETAWEKGLRGSDTPL